MTPNTRTDATWFGPLGRAAVVLAAAGGLAGRGALAQEAGKPTREDPPVIHPRTEPPAQAPASQPVDSRPERPRPAVKPIEPDTKPPIEPAHPGVPEMQKGTIPGLENSDFKIAPAPLLAERSTLLLRRGSILRLPTGDLVMVFHKDQDGKADRPMVLLPCQKLQQLEHLLDNRAEPPVFLVTGQVYVYQGINYLLPTAYSVVAGGEKESAVKVDSAAKSAAPESPTSSPPIPPNTDQAVQDLIKQLEAQRRGPRGIDRSPGGAERGAGEGPGSEAGSAGEGPESEKNRTLIQEGQTVVRRRGRMVRGAGGDWEFAVDRGTGGDPGTDRPMILAPCLNLQRMEAYAALKGDAASFEVSGTVRIYHGRNYLAPTLFQVYLPNDLEPRQ